MYILELRSSNITRYPSQTSCERTDGRVTLPSKYMERAVKDVETELKNVRLGLISAQQPTKSGLLTGVESNGGIGCTVVNL
jgi:hypothetical protein